MRIDQHTQPPSTMSPASDISMLLSSIGKSGRTLPTSMASPASRKKEAQHTTISPPTPVEHTIKAHEQDPYPAITPKPARWHEKGSWCSSIAVPAVDAHQIESEYLPNNA